MRKTVVATITAGALALTACSSDNETGSQAPGDSSDHVVAGPVTDVAEVSEDLEEFLLSSQGVSGWDEATEGWARDVVGTDVNGSTLLVHTTFDANDGGTAGDAENIGREVVELITGHPATENIGRVTVTYNDGRGAYLEQL